MREEKMYKMRLTAPHIADLQERRLFVFVQTSDQRFRRINREMRTKECYNFSYPLHVAGSRKKKKAKD